MILKAFLSVSVLALLLWSIFNFATPERICQNWPGIVKTFLFILASVLIIGLSVQIF